MPQRKILIVEDEFVLYDELCEFFEEKGFAIIKNENEVAVTTYEEAVQLMKQQKPDIALLDIRLDSEKDGIDLGIYIRQHYYIPVVYLSGNDNDENIARIRKVGHDKFVYKSAKPIDKRQLWATFQLALEDIKIEDPDKAKGRFFSVKEMQISKSKSNSRLPQTVIKDPDPLEIEKFVQWEEIQYIETYNATTAGKGHNNLLIHTSQADKAYIMRSTMDDIEEQLPNTFIRFNQSIIVNFLKITGKAKPGNIYFIGDLSFKISDVYKARSMDKINRLLGKNGEDHFPK